MSKLESMLQKPLKSYRAKWDLERDYIQENYSGSKEFVTFINTFFDILQELETYVEERGRKYEAFDLKVVNQKYIKEKYPKVFQFILSAVSDCICFDLTTFQSQKEKLMQLRATKCEKSMEQKNKYKKAKEKLQKIYYCSEPSPYGHKMFSQTQNYKKTNTQSVLELEPVDETQLFQFQKKKKETNDEFVQQQFDQLGKQRNPLRNDTLTKNALSTDKGERMKENGGDSEQKSK